MNCIIIDDDEMSSNALKHLIQQVSYLKFIKNYSCPLEGLESLRNEPVDLLFLDIEMPKMTGMDLIRSLDKKPLIILTTSHTEYALEAFEHRVVDYLVKPVQLPRFLQAVTKAKELFGITTDRLDSFTQDFIFLRKNSVLIKVPYREILWAEALGDYVTIQTMDQKFTLHMTLKALEIKLPADRFVRVHRSYIVQLEQIKTIDDFVISIKDHPIPIGSLYRENFMKRLNLLS